MGTQIWILENANHAIKLNMFGLAKSVSGAIACTVRILRVPPMLPTLVYSRSKSANMSAHSQPCSILTHPR